jgi:hypothetical protein
LIRTLESGLNALSFGKTNFPCKQRADLKKERLDFLKTWSWKESNKSVFRVNTPEGYEALNLESNGKNKYNIILNRLECQLNLSCSVALIDRCNLLTLLLPLLDNAKL